MGELCARAARPGAGLKNMEGEEADPADGGGGEHHAEGGVVGRNVRSKPSGPGKEDPFDLRRRFCEPYKEDFQTALREIKAGRKQSCWSWYIFPTAPWVVNGVERGSFTNKEYALRDRPPNGHSGDEAARAFLRFEADGVNLRSSYLTIMAAVAEQLEGGVAVVRLVGVLDEPKLKSSLELFERVTRGGEDPEVNKVCSRALQAGWGESSAEDEEQRD